MTTPTIRITNGGVDATLTAESDDAPVIEPYTTDVIGGNWAYSGTNTVKRHTPSDPLESVEYEYPEPESVNVRVTGRLSRDDVKKLKELVREYDTLVYEGRSLTFPFTPADDGSIEKVTSQAERLEASSCVTTDGPQSMKFCLCQSDSEEVEVLRRRRGDAAVGD